MMILSIIVPIYNLEHYLVECLNSIISRIGNLKIIEIILINDGSTDNSARIADSYVAKYSFITFINQINQGVSIARNNGLLQAQGEYIWFVDGDDWLKAESSIGELLKIISHLRPDVIFIPVIKSSNLDTNENSFFDSTSDKEFKQLIPNLVSNKTLTYYCYDKIVRKEILINNQIFFPKNILIAEDFYWNLQLFQHVKTFRIFTGIRYIYRINREGSATGKLNDKKLSSLIEILTQAVREIETYELDNHTKENLLIYTLPVWCYVTPEIIANSRLKPQYIDSVYNIFLTYQKYQIDLPKYHRGTNLLTKLVKLLGFKRGINIYAHLINIKRTRVGESLLSLISSPKKYHK